jgi:hypothetical protein
MTAKERLDQHDKQIKAIRGLVHEGMRLVILNRKDLRQLTAKQDRTEAMLQDLIASLKGGGKKKLDM